MSKCKFFAPLPPGICGPAPGYKAATAVTTQYSGTQHNLKLQKLIFTGERREAGRQKTDGERVSKLFVKTGLSLCPGYAELEQA